MSQLVYIAGISTKMLRFFPQRLIAVSCILKKMLKKKAAAIKPSLHISLLFVTTLLWLIQSATTRWSSDAAVFNGTESCWHVFLHDCAVFCFYFNLNIYYNKIVNNISGFLH